MSGAGNAWYNDVDALWLHTLVLETESIVNSRLKTYLPLESEESDPDRNK